MLCMRQFSRCKESIKAGDQPDTIDVIIFADLNKLGAGLDCEYKRLLDYVKMVLASLPTKSVAAIIPARMASKKARVQKGQRDRVVAMAESRDMVVVPCNVLLDPDSVHGNDTKLRAYGMNLLFSGAAKFSEDGEQGENVFYESYLSVREATQGEAKYIQPSERFVTIENPAANNASHRDSADCCRKASTPHLDSDETY